MSEPTSRLFAVVPAAGRGTRMGAPKLLLPWRGGTLLEASLAAWRDVGLQCLVVVCHPDDAEVAEAAQRAGAIAFRPANAPPDMRASLEAGLDWMEAHQQPRPPDAWLVAPADMPLLDRSAILAVIAAHRADPSAVVVPYFSDRAGHPVLLPWPLVGALRELPAGTGLNDLVARSRVRRVEWLDASILHDVDTPDDYRRLSGPA